MFKFRKKKPSVSVVSSLIGQEMTIAGNVTFKGGLRLEGNINGDIVGVPEDGINNTMLVLTKGAQINGSVCVGHAVIDGPIFGSVFTFETLELKSNAQINGDITYKDLIVHTGAIVNGKLIYSGVSLQTPPKEIDETPRTS
jgi:cytoskeletal protein CcmA (bactofilin family)